MAVLTYSEIDSRILDLCQINVTTDAPVSTTERARFINDAYALVWEHEGGAIKQVTSATAWTSASTATGIVTGILTDINEIEQVFASTTSGSTGFSSGDHPLDKAEQAYIQNLRGTQGGYGSYARPKVYSVTRLGTTTPASVGFHQLDYWPSVTGFYFPTHYIAQFTPIDSVTVTTPDVTDLGSRDIACIAAATITVLLGRPEFVSAILAEVSEKNAALAVRKREALLSGDQNR